MAATCLTMDARVNAPVGRKAIDAILDEGEKLYALAKDAFEPYEGVYRLSDCGEYVSAWEFESFWEKRPGWMRKAWMLAGNGQYSPRRYRRHVAPGDRGRLRLAGLLPGVRHLYRGGRRRPHLAPARNLSEIRNSGSPGRDASRGFSFGSVRPELT